MPGIITRTEQQSAEGTVAVSAQYTLSRMLEHPLGGVAAVPVNHERWFSCNLHSRCNSGCFSARIHLSNDAPYFVRRGSQTYQLV
uniref:Uncharacterized protein n=1 Tax=Anopheles dirus TaxID=7168 RepID=A0A182NWL2_9DIPT